MGCCGCHPQRTQRRRGGVIVEFRCLDGTIHNLRNIAAMEIVALPTPVVFVFANMVCTTELDRRSKNVKRLRY